MFHRYVSLLEGSFVEKICRIDMDRGKNTMVSKRRFPLDASIHGFFYDQNANVKKNTENLVTRPKQGISHDCAHRAWGFSSKIPAFWPEEAASMVFSMAKHWVET